MNLSSFKNVIYKMCLEIIYLIYLYKKDLALNMYNSWWPNRLGQQNTLTASL